MSTKESNQTSKLQKMVHASPDSKVHGANMGPTWVLSAADRPHVGPLNLAIRVIPISPGELVYVVVFVGIPRGLVPIEVTHIHHGNYSGVEAIMWSPQRQWSNTQEYR